MLKSFFELFQVLEFAIEVFWSCLETFAFVPCYEFFNWNRYPFFDFLVISYFYLLLFIYLASGRKLVANSSLIFVVLNFYFFAFIIFQPVLVFEVLFFLLIKIWRWSLISCLQLNLWCIVIWILLRPLHAPLTLVVFCFDACNCNQPNPAHKKRSNYDANNSYIICRLTSPHKYLLPPRVHLTFDFNSYLHRSGFTRRLKNCVCQNYNPIISPYHIRCPHSYTLILLDNRCNIGSISASKNVCLHWIRFFYPNLYYW